MGPVHPGPESPLRGVRDLCAAVQHPSPHPRHFRAVPASSRAARTRAAATGRAHDARAPSSRASASPCAAPSAAAVQGDGGGVGHLGNDALAGPGAVALRGGAACAGGQAACTARAGSPGPESGRDREESGGQLFVQAAPRSLREPCIRAQAGCRGRSLLPFQVFTVRSTAQERMA